MSCRLVCDVCGQIERAKTSKWVPGSALPLTWNEYTLSGHPYHTCSYTCDQAYRRQLRTNRECKEEDQ